MTFLPILKVTTDQIPERVLVVGDPARLNGVAERLDNPQELALNREYRTMAGEYQGTLIAAISHGVGSAGAGACFSEICQAGATHIIRAGSAGGMQDNVVAGDVVIATGAVREDGLSHKLVPATFPALATPDVVMAMRETANEKGISTHEGLVLTSDMFYPGDVLGSDLPLWQKAGVTAVEMEAATLLVVCALSNVSCGAVVAIDGNPLAQDDGSMETYDPHNDTVRQAVDNCLTIALDSLVAA